MLQNQSKSAEVPFGNPITDPRLVEYTVCRAQLAVLNPSVELGKFVRYEIQTPAGARPSTIVDDQLAILSKGAQDQIRKLVAVERRPHTQNDHYLDTNMDKYLAQFKGLKRKRGEEGETTPTTIDKAEKKKAVMAAIAHLAMAGHLAVTEEDLQRLQKPDEYETELELMAKACAYWKVALKRVIDNIPRSIDVDFLEPLSKSIKNALINELKVFGEDAQARCKEYMDEAPDVVEHRKDLMVRKARLGEAKVAIRRFKM